MSVLWWGISISRSRSFQIHSMQYLRRFHTAYSEKRENRIFRCMESPYSVRRKRDMVSGLGMAMVLCRHVITRDSRRLDYQGLLMTAEVRRGTGMPTLGGGRWPSTAGRGEVVRGFAGNGYTTTWHHGAPQLLQFPRGRGQRVKESVPAHYREIGGNVVSVGPIGPRALYRPPLFRESTGAAQGVMGYGWYWMNGSDELKIFSGEYLRLQGIPRCRRAPPVFRSTGEWTCDAWKDRT